MAVVTVSTNIPEVITRLDAMQAAAVSETRAMLARTAVSVRDVYLASLRDTTPKRTGELAQSSMGDIVAGESDATITIRQTKTVPWKGSAYPLARFLIDGTAPHTILPVNAQALHWEGAAHPVKRVNHPGFPGRDYPGEAMGAAQAGVESVLAATGEALALSVVKAGA